MLSKVSIKVSAKMLKDIFLISLICGLGNLTLRDGIIERWSSFENKILSINIIDIVENVDTSSKCSVWCLEVQNCVSVFFRKILRRCQLHDVLFISPEDGEIENGTSYFSLTTGLCPVGYVNPRHLGMCYRHVLQRVKRDKSESICASKGEHFLVIDSQEKQDHFYKQVSASSDANEHNYFIDGRKEDYEGDWKFHDGRTMTFFSWCPPYPFNEEGEYLVAVVLGCSGHWRNKPGWVARYFICEKDI